MKKQQIHIRISEEEKVKIIENAKRIGFDNISSYLRFIGTLKPTFIVEEGNANIKLEGGSDE